MRPPNEEPKSPPVTDPKWRDWSAPLLEFLNTGPQTWKGIRAWRKRARMGDNLLRNCLAWLEEYGLALCLDNGDGNVRWVGGAWMHQSTSAVRSLSVDE